MPCVKCERCSIFKDDIDPCPGQGVFDPKQCPVEREYNKIVPETKNRFKSRPWGRKKVVGS